MKKIVLSVIAAIFILSFQAAIFTNILSAEESFLNPQTKVNLNNPDPVFMHLYDILCTSLSIYKASVENPQVTIQILPAVSSILKNCGIKPVKLNDDSQVRRSS